MLKYFAYLIYNVNNFIARKQNAPTLTDTIYNSGAVVHNVCMGSVKYKYIYKLYIKQFKLIIILHNNSMHNCYVLFIPLKVIK